MQIKVVRKGVTPAAPKVPTSTCLTAMPMTLDRVNKEVGSEKEDPTAVESLNDAFKKFKPELKFKGRAGEEETEFVAEFVFQSMKDFDPENTQYIG